MFFECLAEDVEYLAAVCLPLFLRSWPAEADEDPFTGIAGHEVPESTDSPLADAVDAQRCSMRLLATVLVGTGTPR